MSILIYLFIVTISVAAVLAAIAIWAPRAPKVRIGALVVTALFIPLAYLQAIELLSKPKPVSFEWFDRDVQLAHVLGASMDEGRAIYLWLRVDGEVEPRYYVMPWRQEAAEKLEDVIDNAIRQNSTVVLKKPFIRKSENEMGDLNAHVIPPPMPPQKLPTVPPRVFNPRQGI
ncbi:MAG: hypothetical protein MJE12_18700 [Alphaproteobacteria bacterium]|nr:hypothetical protein [Alphaproteobacteria bacterium]